MQIQYHMLSPISLRMHLIIPLPRVIPFLTSPLLDPTLPQLPLHFIQYLHISRLLHLVIPSRLHIGLFMEICENPRIGWFIGILGVEVLICISWTTLLHGASMMVIKACTLSGLHLLSWWLVRVSQVYHSFYLRMIYLAACFLFIGGWCLLYVSLWIRGVVYDLIIRFILDCLKTLLACIWWLTGCAQMLGLQVLILGLLVLLHFIKIRIEPNAAWCVTVLPHIKGSMIDAIVDAMMNLLLIGNGSLVGIFRGVLHILDETLGLHGVWEISLMLTLPPGVLSRAARAAQLCLDGGHLEIVFLSLVLWKLSKIVHVKNMLVHLVGVILLYLVLEMVQ